MNPGVGQGAPPGPDSSSARVVIPAFHAALAGIVLAAFGLYRLREGAYVAAMQEDGVVEWLSFFFFAVAGLVAIVRAGRSRRFFDLLVGLFCLFVAGEEISWAQRLIGYVPPELFLEKNFQQETNLHNFSEIFGRPKWILAAALAGYGLLLPAAAQVGSTRVLLRRIGATPPPIALAPWFAVCVGLLAWYPLEYTGEWVEMLAGLLFVAAVGGSYLPLLAAASLPAAILLAWLSDARGASSDQQLGCARAESAALARDVVLLAGDRDELGTVGSLEKRIWSAAEAGYLDWQALAEFRKISCPGEETGRTQARRRYGVDPWGSPYWLQVGEGVEEDSAIAVYSFGPNRRRDLEQGDDIRAIGRWDSEPRR